jgi:hypothetical protein
MTEQKKTTSKKTYKVGDEWTLPKGESIVSLPDGTAVTARGSFTFVHPGTHRCGGVEVTAEDK